MRCLRILSVLFVALFFIGCGNSNDEFVVTQGVNQNQIQNQNVPVVLRFGNILPRADIRGQLFPAFANADTIRVFAVDETGANVDLGGATVTVQENGVERSFSTTSSDIPINGSITGIRIEFGAAVRPAAVQFVLLENGSTLGLGKGDAPSSGNIEINNPTVLNLNGGTTDLQADCTVDPTSLALQSGTSGQLTVRFSDNSDITSAFAFFSDDPAVATVDQGGTVQAGAGTGSTSIRVVFGSSTSVLKTVPVNVTAVSNVLTVSPADQRVPVGAMIQFQAARGNDAAVGTWSVTGQQTVGNIDAQSGAFTATIEGISTISFVEASTNETATTSIEVFSRQVVGIQVFPADGATFGTGSAFVPRVIQVFNDQSAEPVDSLSDGTITSSNPSVFSVSNNQIRCEASSSASADLIYTFGNFTRTATYNCENFFATCSSDGASFFNRVTTSSPTNLINSVVTDCRASTYSPDFTRFYVATNTSPIQMCSYELSNGGFSSLLGCVDLPLDSVNATFVAADDFPSTDGGIVRRVYAAGNGFVSILVDDGSSLGSPTTISVPGNINFMSFDTKNKFLLATLENQDQILVMNMTSDGDISDQALVSFPGITRPNSFAFTETVNHDIGIGVAGDQRVSFYDYDPDIGRPTFANDIPMSGFECYNYINFNSNSIAFLGRNISTGFSELFIADIGSNGLNFTTLRQRFGGTGNAFMQASGSTNPNITIYDLFDTSTPPFSFLIQNEHDRTSTSPFDSFIDSYDFNNPVNRVTNTFVNKAIVTFGNFTTGATPP